MPATICFTNGSAGEEGTAVEAKMLSRATIRLGEILTDPGAEPEE
jgi:hypothetical protein